MVSDMRSGTRAMNGIAMIGTPTVGPAFGARSKLGEISKLVEVGVGFGICGEHRACVSCSVGLQHSPVHFPGSGGKKQRLLKC